MLAHLKIKSMEKSYKYQKVGNILLTEKGRTSKKKHPVILVIVYGGKIVETACLYLKMVQIKNLKMTPA